MFVSPRHIWVPTTHPGTVSPYLDELRVRHALVRLQAAGHHHLGEERLLGRMSGGSGALRLPTWGIQVPPPSTYRVALEELVLGEVLAEDEAAVGAEGPRALHLHHRLVVLQAALCGVGGGLSKQRGPTPCRAELCRATHSPRARCWCSSTRAQLWSCSACVLCTSISQSCRAVVPADTSSERHEPSSLNTFTSCARGWGGRQDPITPPGTPSHPQDPTAAPRHSRGRCLREGVPGGGC